MRKTALGVWALGVTLASAAGADSDVGGHTHAGSMDHHTMHDQISDKTWEFYGALYASLQSNDAGEGLSEDGNKSQRNTWLTTDGTTLGFRGSIPLEGDFKAVWQIESTINFDEFGTSGSHSHVTQPSSYNDSELAGGHNSFLGLSGDWGTALAGKHNTPFFDATIQFDLFHHLPGDVRAMLGRLPNTESGTGDHHGGTFNVSAPDTVMYKSPRLIGDITFEGAVFALNETLESDGVANPSAFGIGARWAQPMFTLVASYEEHKNYDRYDHDDSEATASLLIDKTSAVLFGGMLHFFEGNTMIGAFAEQLKMEGASASVPDKTRDGYYVSFQQRFMTKNKFKLAYAKAGELDVQDGGQMYVAAYAREMGPGTEIYLTYAMTDNDENADYSNGTIGPIAAGGDPETIAFGIMHMF